VLILVVLFVGTCFVIHMNNRITNRNICIKYLGLTSSEAITKYERINESYIYCESMELENTSVNYRTEIFYDGENV